MNQPSCAKLPFAFAFDAWRRKDRGVRALPVMDRVHRGASRRAFMASLVVAFVVLSLLADSGATQRIVTGTVTEFEAGEWMSVANQTTDPMGFRIALRETTAYEGSPAAIKPGVRVTVWYRSVAERRPVADRVRALPDAATH